MQLKLDSIPGSLTGSFFPFPDVQEQIIITDTIIMIRTPAHMPTTIIKLERLLSLASLSGLCA